MGGLIGIQEQVMTLVIICPCVPVCGPIHHSPDRNSVCVCPLDVSADKDWCEYQRLCWGIMALKELVPETTGIYLIHR